MLGRWPSSDYYKRLVMSQEAMERRFCDLYSRHWSAVRSAVRRRLKDKSAADDVAQEVFESLWLCLPRLPAERDLRPWLLLAGAHRAYSWNRSRAVSSDVDPDLISIPPLAEVASDCHRLLAALPFEQALTVWACEALGLSASTVAGMLSIPLGTIKSRLRFGLRHLRDLIKK